METYIVTYAHESGYDTYEVKADWFPTTEEVVGALDIDFEPHKAEDITIDILRHEEPVPVLVKDAQGNVSATKEEKDIFQKYVEAGGEVCPYCGSSEFLGGSVDIDMNYAVQKMTCEDCNKTWRDVYTLTSAEEV